MTPPGDCFDPTLAKYKFKKFWKQAATVDLTLYIKYIIIGSSDLLDVQ